MLDPCKEEDVKLLTFEANGMPMSFYSEDEDAITFNRVEKSIELYHLDHNTFVNARIEIRVCLSKYIKQAKLLFQYCTDSEEKKRLMILYVIV